MRMWAYTDDDGRVLATTDTHDFAIGMHPFDFPDGFDFTRQSDWRIVDGELVYDPLPPDRPDTSVLYGMQVEAAVPIVIGMMTGRLSDEQAETIPLLIPLWEAGGVYATGDIVRHEGGLWRALRDSMGDAAYPPDSYVAGWKRIGEPDEQGYYPWSQPLGATDAYPEGAVVSHNGQLWVNTVANNVWEPGVYGWNPYTGDTPDAPDVPTVQEWVQPTGAHDSYKTGDRVTHNGATWESTVDGNVWEPGVYGWNQIL